MTHAIRFLAALLATSTATFAAAWLLSRSIPRLAVREAAWKSALLLSLLAPIVYTTARAHTPTDEIFVHATDPALLAELRAQVPDAAQPVPTRLAVIERGPRPGWHTIAFAAAIGWSVARLLLLLVRTGRAWRGLRDRTPAPPALQRIANRCARRHVRVTVSDGISTPVALGNREICLPAGDIGPLGDARLTAVIAHEVAHIERADIAWARLATICQELFAFQPLFRLARREIADCAEFAADARAAAGQCEPVALANVLLYYACTHPHASGTGLSLTAESRFVLRVRRLLEQPPQRPPRATGGYVALASIALLVAGANILPPEPIERFVDIRVTAQTPQPDPAVRLRHSFKGVTREITVRRAGEVLRYDYRVNGSPARVTRATQAWLHTILPLL